MRMYLCICQNKNSFLYIFSLNCAIHFSILFQYFSRSDLSMYFYSVLSVLYCDLSISFFFLVHLFYVCMSLVGLMPFFFLFIYDSCCVYSSLWNSLSLFLFTWRFRTTTTTKTLQYIWHLSFFFSSLDDPWMICK